VPPQRRSTRLLYALDLTTMMDATPGLKPDVFLVIYGPSADEHFVWDVLWQGLKPDVFSIVYGPTKVVP
jgi:hypothetical protein